MPVKKDNVTTYGVTLDHCPFFAPQPWLKDLIDFYEFGDLIDLQNSAVSYVADYKFAKLIAKSLHFS